MKTPIGAVVAGIDDSADSDRGLAWAAAEAGARGVPLHLLHALPPLHADVPLTTDESRLLHAAAGRLVDRARESAQRAVSVPVTAEVVDDSPGSVLVSASRRAALLVLGARGHNAASSLLLGSVSEQMCAHAHCPVVVVREPADPRARRIVVGADSSSGSDQAVGYAMQVAARDRLPVTVLHGWRDHSPHTMGMGSPAWEQTMERMTAAQRALEQALAPWASKYPEVDLTVEAIPVPPARLLADASEHAAMIVVGARGRSGFPGLHLGSVTRAVLHHARCPVTVAR